MHEFRLPLLIMVIALICAGLGGWLGATIADDTGTIVLVAVTCGVLGSFAPVTLRWAADARHRDREPR